MPLTGDPSAGPEESASAAGPEIASRSRSSSPLHDDVIRGSGTTSSSSAAAGARPATVSETGAKGPSDRSDGVIAETATAAAEEENERLRRRLREMQVEIDRLRFGGASNEGRGSAAVSSASSGPRRFLAEVGRRLGNGGAPSGPSETTTPVATGGKGSLGRRWGGLPTAYESLVRPDGDGDDDSDVPPPLPSLGTREADGTAVANGLHHRQGHHDGRGHGDDGDDEDRAAATSPKAKPVHHVRIELTKSIMKKKKSSDTGMDTPPHSPSELVAFELDEHDDDEERFVDHDARSAGTAVSFASLVGSNGVDTQPFKRVVLDRAGWLVGLLVLQSCSSFILERNEELLQEHLVIVNFLTMLVGAGGNAGNQASVRVIRGLAVGTLNNRTMKAFLKTEAMMGICLSCILAVAGFVRAAVFRTPAAETIAITTSLYMIVIISVGLGALLPLAMNCCGIDPAHSSTTIQVLMDILGVTITVTVSALVLSTGFGRTVAEVFGFSSQER